jgi:1-acyl-sn-glycerol-3-phosphate acyltransferase
MQPYLPMTIRNPDRRRAPTPRRRAWTQQQNLLWYRTVYALVGLLLRFWVRCYQATGSQHVPRSGGAFLIANHSTGMDPLLIGYAVKQRVLRGPGKVELFVNPVFSYLMRALGIFPLRQDGADAAGVRTMVDLYRHGGIVVVYPEGGRSATGQIKSFNPGFTRLAIKLKAPVIPAAVAGGRDLLPIGARIPRPRTPVAVIIGEQLDLSEFYGQPLTPELIRQATDVLESRVRELFAQASDERDALAQRG